MEREHLVDGQAHLYELARLQGLGRFKVSEQTTANAPGFFQISFNAKRDRASESGE
jgi:hypothetical protein